MSDTLKRKLAKLLREKFAGSKDRIVIQDGYEDFLHLYVVSSKFQGKPPREKYDMLWSLFFQELSEEEWGRISLSIPLTPREAKSYWPPIPELNGH